MPLPLYYKAGAGRRWPVRLCPRTLRRRGIVLGSLAILAFAMLGTTLLVSVWTRIEETPLTKRGLENGDDFTKEGEKSDPELNSWRLQHVDEDQPATTTATASAAALESPVDLLGGLTGVMSNFHVGQTKSAPSPTDVPIIDPFLALSAAFQQAIANGELLYNGVNTKNNNIEARQNNGYIQDSIVWAGHPSLLSMLSGIVDQVCVIDSGAGARLIDAILSALPVNSMGITSIIPSVAEYSSVSAADMLPLLLPAMAAALGKHLEQPRIADTQNIDGIMANMIWHGGAFVGEIINSKLYLASTELYDVVNRVAGLMCAAADHLTLPICAISKRISGTTYEIVIPCDCIGSPSPTAASQPPQSYVPEKTTSAMDWTVMTMSTTAGYSFPSFSPSDIPPKYGKSTSDPTPSASMIDVPAQSTQPYSEQLQTSCTSALPPAYSTLSQSMSAKEYTEPDGAAPTAACPVCSCPSDAPPAYSSSSVDHTTAVPEEVPPEYGYEGQKSTNPTLSTTECATDQSPQSTEPTTSIDTIPEYSQHGGNPGQNRNSYNKDYNIPGTDSYFSSPRGWRYLGCFSDTPERVVQGGGPKGFFRGDVSNRKCMDYCKSNGFTTAGTEDGSECWCGHSIAENTQPLPATACSTVCQGDASDYCGGTWAVSIYTSEDQNQTKPKYRTLSELLALN